MSAIIKNALATKFVKDEETERICQFIADFITKYGYILSTQANTIRIEYFFQEGGSHYPGKLFLNVPGASIYRSLEIEWFSHELFQKIMKKEGATLEKIDNQYYLSFNLPKN